MKTKYKSFTHFPQSQNRHPECTIITDLQSIAKICYVNVHWFTLPTVANLAWGRHNSDESELQETESDDTLASDADPVFPHWQAPPQKKKNYFHAANTCSYSTIKGFNTPVTSCSSWSYWRKLRFLALHFTTDKIKSWNWKMSSTGSHFVTWKVLQARTHTVISSIRHHIKEGW